MIFKNLIPTASAVTSVTGTYQDLGDLDTCSVQIVFTGSNVVGTMTLESSTDGTNFVTVDSSSQNVTGSGGVMYNLSRAGYRYIRPKWVYTSGTGNITANIYIKENVVKNG